MPAHLSDLRRNFYGGSANQAERDFLIQARDLGINAASLLDGSAYSDTFATPAWAGAQAFCATSGSPSFSHRNRLPAWSMDAAAVEGIGAGWLIGAEIPASWATVDVVLFWTNAGAGSGDVVWRLDTTAGGDGDALAVPTVGTPATVTAPALDVRKSSTIASGIAIPDDGDVLTLALWRLATDGADTLANDAAVIGVRLVKAS